MNQRRNPYRSPAEPTANHDQSRSEQVKFDGEVTIEDVAKLIRIPHILTIMRILAVLVLVSFLVLSVMVLIMVLVIDRTETQTAIQVMVGVIGLIVLVVGLNRMLSRMRRAMRLIEKQPDIVGKQRGELNSEGIIFFNGFFQEHHHLSWSAFPEVVVNSCGIRLDLCNQDGAFIAIPSRMIDRFDRQNIDSVVGQFRANSTDPPIYQSIPVWSNAPDGAIRFQNVIPARVSQQINTYLYMLIVIASTVVGCMVLIILDLDSVIAVMVAVSVCAGAELYRVSAHVKRSDLSYGRWGWLTAEGCELRLPESKYAFDWLDPTELEFDENGVRAKFDNGGEFWLAPDDVMSDDWSKLTDWIESRRSSKHDSTGLLQ